MHTGLSVLSSGSDQHGSAPAYPAVDRENQMRRRTGSNRCEPSGDRLPSGTIASHSPVNLPMCRGVNHNFIKHIVPVVVNPVQLLADRLLIHITGKRLLSSNMILLCAEDKNKRPLIAITKVTADCTAPQGSRPAPVLPESLRSFMTDGACREPLRPINSRRSPVNEQSLPLTAKGSTTATVITIKVVRQHSAAAVRSGRMCHNVRG